METAQRGNAAFRRFWLSQSASFFAYQMLTVGMGWTMYDLTSSALSLGLVGLAEFLPQFLLALVAGQVADRLHRQRIVMTCQIIDGLMTLALAITSLTGHLGQHGLYAAAVVLGASRAFESPSQQSLLPTLVESAELPRVMAVTASARQMGFILGPVLGGVLYLGGPWVVFGFCALAYIYSAVAMGGISQSAIRQTLVPKGPITMDSVLGGIRFIRSKPDILGAISMDLFGVLLGGATALLPIYARDILHTGPWGLGVLRASPAVGALAMSVVLARNPMRRNAGRKMFLAVAGFGLATIVFGLSRNFALSFAALVVLGACDMVSVVVRQTLVQVETPDEMRGRVSAVNWVFIGTSNQLGEFESGIVAAALGATASVVLGGVGTLLVVALWMRVFPTLWQRDSLVPGEG